MFDRRTPTATCRPEAPRRRSAAAHRKCRISEAVTAVAITTICIDVINVSITFVEHLEEERRQIAGRVELDAKHPLGVPSADGPQVRHLHEDLRPVHRLMRPLLGDVAFVGAEDRVLESLDGFRFSQSRPVCKTHDDCHDHSPHRRNTRTVC